MLDEYVIKTDTEEFINITSYVNKTLVKSGITNGICVVFCPHTTAGITINENADPDVPLDIRLGLCNAFPNSSEYRHCEGNSTAHIKASCMGSSVTVIIKDGKLLLGTWQGVFFCEFDGPRNRTFYVKLISD